MINKHWHRGKATDNRQTSLPPGIKAPRNRCICLRIYILSATPISVFWKHSIWIWSLFWFVLSAYSSLSFSLFFCLCFHIHISLFPFSTP